MTARIGVDVGGTFTDVYVVRDGEAARAKADSTAYDLRVGFFNSVRTAGEQFGLTLDELLAETESIVYSTTVGTNALIEHRGPKLGLITTMGYEDTMLIGRGRSWADGLPIESRYDRARAQRPEPLIPPHLIRGVRQRMDNQGNVLMPIQDEDVLAQVQHLVDQGVRGFVVVFLYSYVNPEHEQRVRELIRQQYPESYLGHMPVFLSSDVSPQMGEYRRTTTCVLDAFLRIEAESHLLGLTDDCRDKGYEQPFLIAKCTGGASSLSRTRPIHMFGSGPVAGIVGAAEVGRSYGVKNVLMTDMGGTSFDLGLIVEGRERIHDFDPVIDRWRVQVPLVAHWSIGAGGGSLARVEEGILRVGPQSAKALPGPACYGRGGDRPTVTDADVVLGYIDPDYFLGGRIRLDAERARAAVREHVAEPLGMDLHTAAWSIKQMVDGMMGQEIYRIAALTSGLDPRDFTVFAFGGAGPVHASGYAAAADVSTVAMFAFGSVAGAFGTLHLDVLQSYERTHSAILYSSTTQRYAEDVIGPFNTAVQELLAEAHRDIDEEGFQAEGISYSLEVLLRFGQQRHSLPVDADKLQLEDVSDVERLVSQFATAYAEAYGPGSVYIEAGVEILGLRLNASAPLPSPPLSANRGSVTQTEQRGERLAFWGPEHGPLQTPVYLWESLAPGTAFAGPALIDSDDSVGVVPPDWTFRLDENRTGWMHRQPAGAALHAVSQSSDADTNARTISSRG
ncbi:MAG: hydantoinase/oxoprolinase family protein [Mycobacteriales bacterium]